MSRRFASLAAEARTKEELEAAPIADGDDDPEDESYELKDVEKAEVAKKGKKSGGPSFNAKRGAGGGICLSDDEEEEAFTKRNEPKKDKPVEEETPKEADDDDGLNPKKKQKLDDCKSMGSILARINDPKKKKKKKKKKGGVDNAPLENSIASLLKEDDKRKDPVKTDLKSAARAALALAGKMQVSEEVRFAGQTINVVRSVDKASGEAKRIQEAAQKEKKMSGLDKIVQELKNPKKAISAVEKSSYDWDKFKEQEGIGEQLENYAKDGYVEKQQFLQRVDMRQFELEKAERDRARAMAALAAAKADKK